MSEKNTKKKSEVDIVQVIKDSHKHIALEKRLAQTSTPENKKPDDKSQEKKKVNWKRLRILGDLTAIIFWLYAIVKLFVYDIDNKLVAAIGSENSWIVEYKFVYFALLVAFLAVFFWRAKTLVWLLYVLGFPFVVIFWKLPKLIIKKKSWALALVTLNSAALAIRAFRYNLISKGLGAVAVTLALFSNNRLLLIISSLVIFGLLIWGLIRTVMLAFKTDWFIQLQEKALGFFDKKPKDQSSKTENELIYDNVMSGKLKILNQEQLTAFNGVVNGNIITNRLLYVWAYQLQKYKQRSLSLIFSLSSFIWLFLGVILSFWLINLSIYKIDPSQFSVMHSGTRLEFLLYSLSSVYVSTAAGIEPVKSIALLSSIVAPIIGSVFVLTVGFGIFMSFKQNNDDRGLDSLVGRMKQRAGDLEKDFQKRHAMSSAEFADKIKDFETGLKSLIELATRFVPEDFMKTKD